MDLFTRDRLDESLAALGAGLSNAVFDALHAAYAADDRYYHTVAHIEACLQQLERYRALAKRPHEVAVALWFHDAVYDPRRDDNELRSAAWAKEFLIGAGAAADIVENIADMILATRSHQGATPDARLMVDIDLGILGASLDDFERYDQAIRQEYSWVPETEYRAARARVLRHFLSRERIYQTSALAARFEAQARENLRWKIELLER